MEEFEINFDPKRYYKKKDVRMGSVNYNLANNTRKVSLEEMADLIGNKGHAFCRALLKDGRKEENFIRQDFLVLDFDGTLAYKEFKERSKKYHLPYAFTYKTLSCTKQDFRFRAVFVMNIPVTEQKFAKAMNELIYRMFPEADKNCQDLPRIMLGGKGIIEKNLEGRLDILHLVYSVQDYMFLIQPRNYNRDLKRLADKIGVRIYNGRLGFARTDDIPKGEKKNFIIQAGIVMLCAAESQEKENKADKRKNKMNLSEIKGYDEETLKKACPLLQDHLESDEDLPHQYKFLLASSLCHVSGGKKIFFQGLKEHRKKWEGDWENCIKYYAPRNVKEFVLIMAKNASAIPCIRKSVVK